MKTDSFSLSKRLNSIKFPLWMKKVSIKFHSRRVTEKKQETERKNGCSEIPGPPQRRWLRRWLRHRRRLRGSPFLTLSLSLSKNSLSLSLSKIVNCCCFLQTLKFQLFSLTSVVPDDQKVLSLSLSLSLSTCLCVCIYIFKNLW